MSKWSKFIDKKINDVYNEEIKFDYDRYWSAAIADTKSCKTEEQYKSCVHFISILSNFLDYFNNKAIEHHFFLNIISLNKLSKVLNSKKLEFLDNLRKEMESIRVKQINANKDTEASN